MTVFLDASAALRDLLSEGGYEEVRSARRRARTAASSLLLPECMSGIRRMDAEGRIPRGRSAALISYLVADWNRIDRIDVSVDIAEQAAELVTRHRLRGADACVLASALSIGPNVALATFDARMRAAAASEGLSLIPA